MAAQLDRLGIARTLREMARLLDLAGEPVFKVRAYERGAQAIEHSTADLANLVHEGRLTELTGIGPRLAGGSGALDKLRQQLPPGTSELSRIPELGLKKIKALNAALGIETIAQLKEGCEAGRARTVKGIGEKTEQRILDRIRRLEGPTRMLLSEAGEAAEELLAHLRDAPGAGAVDVAGAFRRCTETVDGLVFVVASAEPSAAAEHARSAPLLATVERNGPVCRATLVTGLPLEVRL